MSKYPIYVLEGADGVGKTTLANSIVKWTGAHYMHMTYRFKNKMFDYHTAGIELALKHSDYGPVVIDRWWPSEVIYANVYRGGSKWPMAFRFLDRVALKHGLTYVFCIPSDRTEHEARFAKLQETGREMYTGTMEQVATQYLDLYNIMKGRNDVVLYDIDTHGQNLVDFTQSLIDRATDNNVSIASMWEDRENRLVAGNSDRPAMLIIGDQSKPKTRRKIWPFFEYGNCSLWLANALEKAEIPEKKLAWANAYENEVLLAKELDRAIVSCAPSRIITLGEHANRAVRLLGYSRHVTGIGHPQYYRRFKHNDISDVRALRTFL